MRDIEIINIDFKANKERIKARKRKENRKNKMFKIGMGVIVAVVVIGILLINKNLTDNAMESCQKLEHSYNYCIAHV